MQVANRVANLDGDKLRLNWNGGDIYYTTVEGLGYELSTAFKLRRIIDEGYWDLFNLDTNDAPVKKLAKILSANRNRQHLIIVNFPKLTRVIKVLLEISTMWIHKPHPDWAYVYVKDREFIGDDPYSVADLLKAPPGPKKRWYLKHNPNYIKMMKVPMISQKVFDKYEINKSKAQSELARADMVSEESKKRMKVIVEELFQKFKQNKFNILTAKTYITTNYGVGSLFVDRYVRELKNRINDENFYNRINAEKKEAEGEEVKDTIPTR